ncbi:MAG: TatD family hydrolase, partial [Treponema sp.]|nr:TatD family hydrolase [Treponema sp.]
MLTDAHCHPCDLAEIFPGAEDERRQLGVMCAASATDLTEFEFCERLSRQAKTDGTVPLLPCFAVHPQLAAMEQLATLETLASQARLAAIGETGFDLFNEAFKKTETIQDELFAAHLEIALRYDLPLILHVRRAMHKVFAHSETLKKCRAVIFHSWPGTAGEGEALLKRGINAFFSFGTSIMLNHHQAMRCCALFPADRLLAETDAPYQALRGREFSSYGDLPRILEAAAALRREAGTSGSTTKELEKIVEDNFRSAFSLSV